MADEGCIFPCPACWMPHDSLQNPKLYELAKNGPPPSAIEAAAVEYVRQFKRLDVDPRAVRDVDAAHVALWEAVAAVHPELKP